MHAAVFDIDGTLLQSAGEDDDMYKDAVRSMYPDVYIRPELSDYDLVSDTGILSQIFTDNSIREDSNSVSSIKSTFIELLTQHIAAHGPFVEIPGAKNMLSRLMRSSNHVVAIATGGWRESALLKLDTSGFSELGCPVATSDDAPDRKDIMKIALAPLGKSFSSITYYGDGTWDRDATEALGWNFVPVGPALGGLEPYVDLDDV